MNFDVEDWPLYMQLAVHLGSMNRFVPEGGYECEVKVEVGSTSRFEWGYEVSLRYGPKPPRENEDRLDSSATSAAEVLSVSGLRYRCVTERRFCKDDTALYDLIKEVASRASRKLHADLVAFEVLAHMRYAD